MPKGPHESRLDHYVTHGDATTISSAATTWGATAEILQNLAMALEIAKPHLLERFGPKTGAAAAKAFDAVRHNVLH